MSRYSIIILICVPVVYVILAAADIERPGIGGSEATHAPAAIRLLQPELARNLWVDTTYSVAGRDLPVMLIPYLGAVKSYLLAAAFLFLGSSVATLRFTMIAVGAAAIVFTYLFTRRGWGTLCALITTAAIATDPSFILMTRADWGPVALPALFRSAALYALIVWHQERKLIYLGAAGLLLGLGVFDKSNFLWFVFALIPIGFAAWVARRIRPSPRELFVLGGAFLIGSSPLWWWNITNGWATLSAASEGSLPGLSQGQSRLTVLLGALPSRLLAMRDMFAGHGLDSYMFGAPIAPWLGTLSDTLILPVFALTLLLAVFFTQKPILFSSIDWPRLLFPAAMIVLLIAQMLITQLTIWYHHFIFMYPFPQLFIGAVLSQAIIRIKPGTYRYILRPAAGIVAVLLILGNGAVTWQFHQLMERSAGSNSWSTAIYSLDDLLMRDYRQDKIELLDWGIGDQLLLLSDGRLSVDQFWAHLYGADAKTLVRSALQDDCKLYVLSVSGTEIMEGPGQTFQAAVAESGKQPLEKLLVNDSAGQPRYMLMDFQQCPLTGLTPAGS